MRVGQVCPSGFLPVYSVDDEETARKLVASSCELGLDGEYYARELFDSSGDVLTGGERIDAFVAFGRRLESLHERIKN